MVERRLVQELLRELIQDTAVEDDQTLTFSNPSSEKRMPVPLDALARTRLILGLTLILFGTIIALAVVYNVYMIVDGVANYPIIQQMIPEKGSRAIGTPNGSIELPERLFTLFGYGLVIILLAVISKVSTIFLRFGSGLLNADLRDLMTKLQSQRGK